MDTRFLDQLGLEAAAGGDDAPLPQPVGTTA
jgi:hypothetical protein